MDVLSIIIIVGLLGAYALSVYALIVAVRVKKGVNNLMRQF